MPRIHVMAGLVPQGADAATVRATYIANVRYAAEQGCAARHPDPAGAHQWPRHARLLPEPPGPGPR